ncbi:uncharacterized protein LOC134271982 isoform X2 [Saccostrea cucullata]|uniref:uncharacterized protein LOC134271982 isoform X2 n=1 Tax=Saccostrea cuccullata TaxID=36930 RepID=UPI002ED42DC4
MLFYFLLELILIGNIVYGLECPDGQFGDNCEGNCSSCPFLETCDTVSGQCNGSVVKLGAKGRKRNLHHNSQKNLRIQIHKLLMMQKKE